MHQIFDNMKSSRRMTKIICTISPQVNKVEMLVNLLDAGMNIARLDFSYGDYDEHAESVANLRLALKQRPGVTCAVMLDTKGPEIQSGFLKDH